MQRPNGFTLVEVLVAMTILSIGLLGLASLQGTSLKFNASATYRSQATNLAYSIIDAMRANRTIALITVAANNPYIVDRLLTPASCPTSVTTLTGTLAQQDIDNWINTLACSFPSGTGSIQVSGGIVTITIQWDDSRGATAAQQFVTTTVL
jgi:type IV pilus assembly protein PilV